MDESSEIFIEQDLLMQFMSTLLVSSNKQSWRGEPVSSQVLADLCIEKKIALPRLHESWYANRQHVRNYLEVLLGKVFRFNSEFVSDGIRIRKESLLVQVSPGHHLPNVFYTIDRVKSS